ncbi:protein-disulfide reductase DsbD [Neisseria sp. Ec49-e6-T10]|uniref:protein-disulfide reductase DsbD n=1 Tax=Neisseria sp. Ec49-e6-T10 TaxID=3140744 RepID=UPI003EB6FF30
MQRFIKYLALLFFIITSLLANTVSAQIDPKELLPAQEAFVPQVFSTDQGLVVEFAIAPKYYLYRDKISINSEPALLGEARYSESVEKEDEFFGKQQVFYQSARIDIPFQLEKNKLPPPFTLTISFQGCSEQGICYPPTTTTFDINGSGVFNPSFGAEKNTKKMGVSGLFKQQTNSNSSNTQQLNDASLLSNLLTFLLSGIALSFTACMYPLLPILSSIIVGSKEQLTKTKGFALSFTYVQGLALTYTLVGIIAGLTGALLTVWLQQPIVVISAAALMVILALAMFDVIQIQMPAKVQSYFTQKSQKLSGGKISSVFAMGMFSALIIGPCVAPPLAIALGYIGQTKDAVLGGALLYAMALGMGIPLIILGTFGGHYLPKAGSWMNTIKHCFGMIILGFAIYLASPFLPIWLSISLYLLLLCFIVIVLMIKIKRQTRIQTKGILGVFCLAFMGIIVFFTISSLQKQSTPLHQILGLHFDHVPVGKRYDDVATLKTAIMAAQEQYPDRPILLDFYADWCITCKQMDANTFSQAKVKALLEQQYQFMQIDVTQNNPDHQALLKEYGLFGPPATIILAKGKTPSTPLLGYIGPAEFIYWLENNTPK